MKKYSALALKRLNLAINKFTAPSISILTPPTATKFRMKSLTIKQPFTLIELLVVILIIGILAAILLPVFVQARNKARHSVDLSNLKQLAISAITYTVDNKDLYPYRDAWEHGAGQEFIKKGTHDERDMMLAYLGDLNGILICPHAPSELDIQGSTATNIRIDYSRYWGISFNNETKKMRMAGQVLGYDNKEFRVLASDYMEEKVSGASFGSHEDSRDVLTIIESLSPVLSSRWGNSAGATSRGHLDLNYVFDDGHAVTISSIITDDERFMSVPRNKTTDTGGLNKWLPPEE